ncbi:MAG: UDP-3-O-(3-hydroxymyristoyl)glucosamine N-acyltransferase [Alphaproteobacteria bacterium]|nr:UDP-3-O-(3-hydroxymyristoyl)glucosamine N-acyltransferase [Alphaproteobacteria bacterium]
MADNRFFSKQGPFTLAQIAAGCEAVVCNPEDAGFQVSDVANLLSATESDLGYLAPGRLINGTSGVNTIDPKIMQQFEACKAGALIVPEGLLEVLPKGRMKYLTSKEPSRSFALAQVMFYAFEQGDGQIHSTAAVDKSAKLGKNVRVGAYAVIEADAEIGEGTIVDALAFIGHGVKLGSFCRVGPHASVSHCLAGDKVIFYPGCRIGQPGFGFTFTPSGFMTIPQLGRVIIGDDVEIGANSTVDRGHLEDTLIGSGSRIDNLVMIAHNVKVGKTNAIAAQAGISGSAKFEDFVAVGGQAGIAGHLKVGMGARIGPQAGVMRDIPAGAEVMGSPAMPSNKFFRQVAALSRLAKGEGKNGKN